MSGFRRLRSNGRPGWNVVGVRAILRVALGLLLVLMPFSPVIALPAAADGPGDLDTTFGTGGKVTTDFGGGDFGYSVAIQSDGRIIVAGYAGAGFAYDFAVARYNADGTLDTTFGAGGKVMTDFGGTDVGKSVSIQSDGRIIVAGYAGAGFAYDFAVARYNADGTLDTAFGVGGKVTTDFQGLNDHGESVAVQGDGSIIVAGSAAGLDSDFALARYTANGSLDTTFGAMGKVITDFGLGDTLGQSVAIQSDGRIIMAGNSAVGGNPDFALARYNANGSLDTTFGAGGKVTTDFGVNEGGASVAVQEDGKIMVGAYTYTGSAGDIALARYNADGTLDTSFGAGGKVTTDFGARDLGSSVAIQSDGKIVVAGGFSIGGGNPDFALVRYNANGSLDTSFGAGGHVPTDFGSYDSGTSVAIQSDGRLVVAGASGPFLAENFALARYLAAEPAPTPTPTPVPGIGWPGLLLLAVGLLAMTLLAGARRARAGGAG